jgi:sulfonate dioxygenase
MGRYPPLEPFEHTEHGKDADPAFPDLLADAKVDDLTGNIGAEVRGVQLSKLSDKGKDQLALFVAQKKVVGMSAFYDDLFPIIDIPNRKISSFP